MSDIPRRIRIDLSTPAELVIRAAVDAVEDLPADVRLTDAVVLLHKARELVADFVDNVPLADTEGDQPTPPRTHVLQALNLLRQALAHVSADDAVTEQEQLLLAAESELEAATVAAPEGDTRPAAQHEMSLEQARWIAENQIAPNVYGLKQVALQRLLRAVAEPPARQEP